MPLSSRDSSERGFTIIEVIVAVLILAIVAGGATMAIMGSTNGTSKLKISDRQKSIASAVLNRALSNRSWIATYNCAQLPLRSCDISGIVTQSDPLLKEPEGTIRHQVTVTATGVDLPADNDASGKDADRQVPDVYRIVVTVDTQAPSTVAALRPWSVSGTLDMSVRASTGTPRLHACEVRAQADERTSVGLCANGAQTYAIQPPGGGSASYCPSVPIPAASHECAAWRQALPAATPGTSAISSMTMTPVAASFTLKGPTTGGTSRTLTVSTSGSGYGEVTDLEPGRYTLTPASSASRVLWQSHSIPSGGEVTIQTGEVNDSVQVFRQVASPVTIAIDHNDITDPAYPRIVPGAVDARAIKLVPVPNGRFALSNGLDRGWTKISKGTTSVTLLDVSPGLYQMGVLEYPGRVKDIFYRTGADASLRYIWVPPTTGSSSVRTAVPSKLMIRDTFCDEPKRLAIMASRITPTQKALGQMNRGFVWDEPGTGRQVWHGPCNNDNPDTGNESETGEAGA